MSQDFNHLRERGLTQEVVFRGHLLKIRVDTVALPNGEVANREIVEHPGAVAVVARTADGQVLLVRQFRYAIGEFSLELPAGCLDKPGENVAAAAERELSEETGHQAAKLIYLGCVQPSPGFTSERTHIFATEGLEASHEAHPDADEFLDLVSVPMEQAMAMIKSGEIKDAKTVVGLLWMAHFGPTTGQTPPREAALAEDEGL